MNKVYGIVGHPVEHSLSPAMHEAAFKAAKIDAEYKRFDIDPEEADALANFCYETELNGIAGFSVTMPFKEAIMDYMDFFDPLAKAVGSINTVNIEENNLIGYNTDATGAVSALQEKTKLPGKKALILGAGGVARAIVYSLKEFGSDVFIFNRTPQKAKALADEFEVDTIDYRKIPLERFDIVINCTPVGMMPNTMEALLHAEQLEGIKTVMDVITAPMETQLIKEAKLAGSDVITGERMLLHQAAGQFETWFGKSAPLKEMEEALYSALDSQL